MRWPIALALVLAGSACTTVETGAVQLDLSLPPSGGLRPVGMTTVAITEIQPDGTSVVSTTELEGDGDSMHFSAGDVAVGTSITLAAELRDSTGRLVGYGEVDTPITPSATKTVTVTIPVRKPIVFVASAMPVTTIDPTRYSIDPMYQGTITQNALIVVPIDGNDVAVVSQSSVQLLATATDSPDGKSIAITGTPTDAAAVPGQRQLVVGTSNGITLVDFGSGTATAITAMAADRVAVGGTDELGYTAYVLSGRVAPPEGVMASCSGSSTVQAIALAGGGAPAQVATGKQLADIAADGTGVFGADPCAGKVTRLDSGGSLTLSLPGAASVAVQHETLWAAGSQAPSMQNGQPVGAYIVLASINTDGMSSNTTDLPPKAEIMQYDDDSSFTFARTMRADTEVPIDLAVLPTGDQVALIARMDSHQDALYDEGTGQKAVPQMDVTVDDVVLVDPTTTALTRIRTNCDLTVTGSSGSEFPDWSCQPATDGGALTPPGGQYTPSSVDAVYGSR
jgi:hypothetical protein